jgi:hypothetical protein
LTVQVIKGRFVEISLFRLAYKQFVTNRGVAVAAIAKVDSIHLARLFVKACFF